jgi:hypothetical protein
MTSCSEFTPEADAYFTVDGKRYDQYVMIVDDPEFPNPVQNGITVFTQGASGYNVTMGVIVPGTTLVAGTYDVSYFPVEASTINSFSIYRNNKESSINLDSESTGSMTVSASGNNYKMDFTGTIQGHAITVHYDGIIAKQ